MWSYPGALFMSAAGYHHHLGTNVWSPGPGPAANEVQLLEWELVVPSRHEVATVGQSLRAAGVESVIYPASRRRIRVCHGSAAMSPLGVSTAA